MNKERKKIGVIMISLFLILLITPISVFAKGTTPEKPEEPVKVEKAEEKAPAPAAEPPAEFREWTLYNLSDYEKETGKKIAKFNEAPMLAKMVASGEIPKIEDRLPKDLLVVDPCEGIGKYGGSITFCGVNMLIGGEFLHVTDSTAFTTPLLGGTKDIPYAFKAFNLSEDGLTYTLYLREGLKWSDGVPATADDVIFWWEDLSLVEEVKRERADLYKVGDELPTVTKINDYEVRFQYKTAPKWDINYTYNDGKTNIYPRHILEKYHIKYNKNADKLAKEKGYDSWAQLMDILVYLPYNAPEELNLEVPTFGAWKFKKQLPDGMIFERNPYYFTVDTEGNQLPYIDEAKVVSVENMELYKMKTLSREVDFASWGLGLNAYPVFAEEAEKGKFRLQLGRGVFQANQTFWCNLDYQEDPVLGKILADKRFRQALSLAIDRDYINETLYFGKAVPSQLTVAPVVPCYREEWARAYADYDPDKANKLLDEMGLKWNADHTHRLRPDDNTLTVEVVTMTNHLPDYMPITEIAKDNWEDIGIVVHIKPVLKNYQYQYCDANKFQIRGRASCYFISNEMIAARRAAEIYMGKVARNWFIWANTGGEGGTEPPEYWKDYVLMGYNLPTTAPPSRLEEVITAMFERQAEELIGIGTVGDSPTPAVIANDLGNVPLDFYGTGTFLGMVPLRPMDWYWKK